MSLPTPKTRKEQYLNAIATGNSDGLPTPITREEEYLDAIAKSGGGSGEGDMKKSVYDSDLDVANAGGISAFVGNAVSDKVDKVEGKGLSTNDYDNTEKGKVADNTSAIEAIENVTGAKNVLPITLESLKAINTSGTWNGNAFTDYGVTFTIYTNNAGFVTSVSATGTATLGNERLYIARNATDLNKYSGMILSGSDDSGDCGILIGNSQSTYAECKGEDTTIGNIPTNEQNTLWLNIYPQKTVSGAVFTPMIRPAGTDSEFVVGSMTNRELTDGLTWKYLMTINDNNAHSIGITFKELYAVGNFGSISTLLLSNESAVRGGFYRASDNNGDMYIIYTNGELTVNTYFINGTNKVSSGVKIYYR